MRALRRHLDTAGEEDEFPRNVVELQAYLDDAEPGQAVRAIPGVGTKVPIWLLGSSLFSAQLAAALGLPYAFASHFAPILLQEAVRVYRERFRPSEGLDHPYVIAGVNVLAADTEAEARRQWERRRRVVARAILSPPGRRLGDEEVDAVLRTPAGRQIDQMLTHTALGTPDAVRTYLDGFRDHAGADELMTVHQADTVAGRLRSLELLAETAGLLAA